jgi:hypothetical protein
VASTCAEALQRDPHKLLDVYIDVERLDTAAAIVERRMLGHPFSSS